MLENCLTGLLPMCAVTEGLNAAIQEVVEPSPKYSAIIREIRDWAALRELFIK